jgi:hypothetical protein
MMNAIGSTGQNEKVKPVLDVPGEQLIKVAYWKEGGWVGGWEGVCVCASVCVCVCVCVLGGGHSRQWQEPVQRHGHGHQRR